MSSERSSQHFCASTPVEEYTSTIEDLAAGAKVNKNLKTGRNAKQGKAYLQFVEIFFNIDTKLC